MTNERFLKMVTIEGETWKPVPGYEGEYMVSSIGKVLFVGRNYKDKNGWTKCIEPHLVTWKISKTGYAQVPLWRGNKYEAPFVHRLVASVFIPNPNNYPHVDHIDTDRLNNDYRNLKWCTPHMNSMNPLTRKHFNDVCMTHDKMGRWVSREVIGINLSDSSDIRHYTTVSESKKDGFNPSQVSASCLGKRKNHRGFVFYYKSEYETLIKSKNESKPMQSDYQHPQPPQLQDPQLPLQFEP